MGTWTNADGLKIRLGVDEAVNALGGEFRTDGPHRVVDFAFDATTLTTSYAALGDGIYIPENYRLMKVQVVAETACTSGGAATLDVGFVRLDGTTAIDEDGAVAALALTSLNVAGETNDLTAGVTSAGALVGAVISSTLVAKLTARVNTAVYTAGRIRVRLYLQKVTSTT